jgi:hypothetical protein
MNFDKIMTSQNPLIRVCLAWVGVAVITIVVRFHLIPLFPHPYWAYMELLFVGFIPVLFTICHGEDWSRYGIARSGLTKSIAWSILYVAIKLIYYRITDGQWFGFYSLHSTLNVPAKIYYASLEVFSYGPLEVFFMVWLVRNMEDIFPGKCWGALVSLTVTAILFALAHFIFQSFVSSILVGITCFVLSLIFQRTQNSIGPMIAWSVLDGQVWQGASMLWS